MWKFWHVYYAPEGQGGSGGGDGGAAGGEAGGGDKGVGAGDQGGAAGGDKAAGGGDAKAVSLRASLASNFEGDDRNDFENWANQYTTDADWAKSAFSMRRQFDARVPVPKPDDPKAMDKFFQRVGKPADPKAYTYDFGKDESGNPVQLDDGQRAQFEQFKEFAHKNHYTQAQFEQAIKFQTEMVGRQETEFDGRIKAARERSVDELREEWGPDFENNINAAVDGGILYAGDEQSWRSFVNLPLANGMLVGDHPTFLRTMAKVGRATGEDQRIRQMKSSGEAENVQTEIKRLEQEAYDKGMSTSQEPYHSQLDRLYKKLYPKKHTGGGMGFGAR